jgi:multiple sugar transport system ATP-binding protein
MAQVEAKQIRKQFGNVTALHSVDLIVNEGEFLVFLGPSGCGKTTFLRIICGLENPTSGELFIGNQPVIGLPPRARGVAMVFQTYGLYPHLKIKDNIGFPLKTQGTPRAEVQPKVEWAAGLLGIGHLLDRKPRQLSGGERQRVALARALVREPAVFLLDEPLSNLDAKLRTSARNELKEFQRRIGTTTVYVTHDQVEAMGMGDRIVVMDHGRICQVGTPTEIYDDPASTFVATFLGTPPMNLVDTSNGALMGFRPENFLHKSIHNDASNMLEIPFRVARVEYLGSERVLYGYLDGYQHEGEVTAKLPIHVTHLDIHEGEQYPFAIQRRDLRYFDRSSGERKARG